MFYQLILPRGLLRSNLAPYRQYQRTTTTTYKGGCAERIGCGPWCPGQSPLQAENLKAFAYLKKKVQKFAGSMPRHLNLTLADTTVTNWRRLDWTLFAWQGMGDMSSADCELV